MTHLAFLLAILALLMLGSLLSSKISSAINMPCLLLFLAVGMLAGSDGIGKIAFDSARTANYLGTAAMAFILFSGGFDTNWKSVRTVLLPGGLLSSAGVLLTALFSGIFTWIILKLALPEKHIAFSWCFLLGAIISSTDAAAVFSILRSRSVSLRGRLRPLLELESGSNDPMAAFLTIFLVTLIVREMETGAAASFWRYWLILPQFLLKMSVGAALGFLLGRLAAWLYNRIDFDYNGLYYVLAVVVILLAYSFAELAYGNGFMAVYTAGMTMGNRKFVFHNGVGRFCDGLAWIMQVILFTMLGLLAFPSHVWEAKWVGLVVALLLMGAARPLAVFACLRRSSFTVPEQILISWVGLRGGAPIMLATFPLLAEIPEADFMFNIVFFIVLTSVLLQGMTIMPMAKLLKLDAPLRPALRMPVSVEETGDANASSAELTVPAPWDGATLAQLRLPEGALVLLVRRSDRFLLPRGDTVLAEGDILTVMGSEDALTRSLRKLAETAPPPRLQPPPTPGGTE